MVPVVDVGEGADDAAKTCKVFQAEFSLAVVVKHCETGRCVILQVPLLCPLQCSDRGTAECLNSLLRDISYIPSLDALRELFALNFDLRCIDKNAANMKCEDSFNWECPGLTRARWPCVIHIISVIQRGAYSPVKELISGMVNGSLAMRPGGAFQKLQQACAFLARGVSGLDV